MARLTTDNGSSGHSGLKALVVGGGPVGWISALSLSQAGHEVTLIAPSEPTQDLRTIALMQGSLTFLERLGLAPVTIADATPLETMRLVDGTRRLLRAPEVQFHASEAGLPHFALNIPVAALIARAQSALADHPRFCRIADTLAQVSETADGVEVRTENGTDLAADLIIAADGKRSTIREQAGISLKSWLYPQTALVTSISHSLPHHNVSTEFHTETGPFTLVPLHGQRCALVCVETPDQAEHLKQLPDTELALEIERRSHGVVGKISDPTARQTFPMTAQIAASMAKDRVFLVGESGHAFPPIGAQGLNLSMRDIEALVSALAQAQSHSISAAAERYTKSRRTDVTSRTFGVDLLNRSLLSDVLPVQFARGIGLYAAKQITPLRKLLMRQGLGAHAV